MSFSGFLTIDIEEKVKNNLGSGENLVSNIFFNHDSVREFIIKNFFFEKLLYYKDKISSIFIF